MHVIFATDTQTHNETDRGDYKTSVKMKQEQYNGVRINSKNAKKQERKLSRNKRTSSRVTVYIISIVGKPTENIQQAS